MLLALVAGALVGIAAAEQSAESELPNWECPFLGSLRTEYD